MSIHRSVVLRWLSRGLAIVVTLFLAAFALDVFGEGRGAWRTALALLVHLLPSLALLAAVVAAWRRPWVGAVACLALASLYVAAAPRRLDWMLVVAGPLVLVGVLFALSWHAARGADGER